MGSAAAVLSLIEGVRLIVSMLQRALVAIVLLSVAVAAGCAPAQEAASAQDGAATEETSAAAASGSPATDTARFVDPFAEPDMFQRIRATAPGPAGGVASEYTKTLVLDLTYGAGDAQPGYLPSNESAEALPEEFAVTGDGSILLVDPVKRRVMVFDADAGGYTGSLTGDDLYPWDVAWIDGSVAVLAPDERIWLFGAAGDESIIEIGTDPHVAVDGFMTGDHGLWLRVDDESHLVLGYGAQGELVATEGDARLEVPGRVWGGHAYQGYADGFVDAGGAIVRRAKPGRAELTVELTDPTLQTIVVGEDARRSFYVDLWTQEAGEWIVAFDTSGREVGRFPLEQWTRDMLVTPDGTVFVLYADETGVRVYRYRLS